MGHIPLRNSPQRYGLVMVSLHWSMAVLIVFLFTLGVYMRTLSYAHPWYHYAPHIHKSFGLIVFALLLVRFFWILIFARPEPPPMPKWETLAAFTVHKLFYILLFIIVISGFLIPTANGRGIELFNFFEVPALISNLNGQEDIAGKFHFFAAYFVAGFTILHTMAALKHHFIDCDEVLRQMLGLKKKKP